MRARFTTRTAALAMLWLLGMAVVPSQQQRSFPTPEDAVRALGEAAKSSDVSGLIALLGPGSEELASSSDAATARKNRDVFVVAMAERWRLQDLDATHKELVIGNESWPFPVPLVKRGGGWVFDTEAGKEEVLARRIGRNELAVIRISETYVREYLGLIRDVIVEGQVAGVFRSSLNPTLAAKLFFGGLDEMATNWILSKRRYSLVNEADAIVDLFVGGLRA